MFKIFSENMTWSIGTIVILFGIIATHRLFLYRNRKSSIASAASDIISAFAPSIARINAAILHIGNHEPPEINEFLKESFEAHAAAIRRFGPFITSRRERKAYEKAWQDYCDLEPFSGGVTLFAGHYAPEGKYLEFIKDKIENILTQIIPFSIWKRKIQLLVDCLVWF